MMVKSGFRKGNWRDKVRGVERSPHSYHNAYENSMRNLAAIKIVAPEAVPLRACPRCHHTSNDWDENDYICRPCRFG